MINPTERDIGRLVTHEHIPDTTGKVYGFNDTYVYVTFPAWAKPIACRRDKLEWHREESDP